MKINDLQPNLAPTPKATFEVADEGSWVHIIPRLWELGQTFKIWLLEGDLGSGKTTLVKHLCRFLGYDQNVDSPTFSLINEYKWMSNDKAVCVFHIDLYRLESLDEIIDIGIEEILDSGELILIEWPELARTLLPEHYFHLMIQHVGDHRKVLVL